MSRGTIILPFDVYTDIKIQDEMMIIYGYSSEKEFKIEKYQYMFMDIDKERGVYVKNSKGRYKVGDIFPINKKYVCSYAHLGDWLLEQGTENLLYLKPYTKRKHVCLEMKLLKEYLSIHQKQELFGIVVRLIYYVFFSQVPSAHEKILLIDRRERAGDNAEALFKFLNFEHKRKNECFFAITRKSEDWKRLCRIGKVIPLNGIKYLKLFWGGATIVSSHVERAVWTPFRARAIGTYNDLVYGKRVIRLGHGVIKDDLSQIYNSTKQPISLFITTTRQEYDYLSSDRYGFVEGQVKLTGMPRYDLLENNSRKVITYMPTWRVSLKSAQGLVDNFESSMYYTIIEKLFVQPEFLDIAEKYGYKVRIMFHPNMKEVSDLVKRKLDSRVTILPYHMSYSQIFSESSLLITDYSSVAFDFAYLRKPLIYYQEDYDSFYSGSHNYVEGYFDYQRDGFGDTVKSKNELLEVIEQYFQTGCRLQKKYADRIEETFAFCDRKNCERVYGEVIKIINEEKSICN